MQKNSRAAKKQLDFAFTVISVKDAGDECVVAGYANTSTKDRVGDVVLPSAFAKSLPTYLKNPILLENHNWDKIAGRTQSAEITDKGLYIEARVSDARPDLKTMVREGCLSTFSIGYNETDSDYDEATKTKIIKDLELLEISIVSVPANTEASFQVVDTKKPDAPAGEAQKSVCEACGEEMKDGKCAKCMADGKSVESLESFLIAVKSAVGEELGDENVIALCDFYLKEGKTDMKLTRKQLIEALRASIKSAQAPAPAPAAEQKPDAGKADPAAEQKPAEGSEAPAWAKELSSKLDAIAQACAQLLEGDQKPEGEAKPEGEQKPEDGKAVAPAAVTPTDGEKALEDMSDDEIAALEAEIDGQLEDLEDAA